MAFTFSEKFLEDYELIFRVCSSGVKTQVCNIGRQRERKEDGNNLRKGGKEDGGRSESSSTIPIAAKIKLRGLSPRANYTDRATTACRRSYCQLLRLESAT
jgi:hypothetical protein